MNKTILILLALFMCFTAPAFAQTIGTIENLKGTATLNGKTALEKGMPISAEDIIKTGPASVVTVVLADDTSITFGENGEMSVDEYVYNTENPESNKARYTLLHTAFQYVSGKISKSQNPDIDIKIDYGSIGIRGTKILRAMKDGECWIYIEEGTVNVSNEHGNVELGQNQGAIIKSIDTSPVAHNFTDTQLQTIRDDLNL